MPRLACVGAGPRARPLVCGTRKTDWGTRMLNIGPRPWGDIHPEEQAALRRIGQMLWQEAGPK